MPSCTRRVLSLATVLCTLVGAVCGQVNGQQLGASIDDRRFDVVSIKPFDVSSVVSSGQGASLQMGTRLLPNGRFTAMNQSVRSLIEHAYQVESYQIVGLVESAALELYTVDAKAPSGSTPDQIAAMLRTLLTERFGLRAHLDTRRMSTSVLSVSDRRGQLGPRIHMSNVDCEALKQAATHANLDGTAAAVVPPALADERACRSSTRLDRRPVITKTINGQRLSVLRAMIADEIKAPVVDQTGLTGPFDLELTFVSQVFAIPGSNTSAAAEPAESDLRTALREQLGLKLETTPGPVQVLVIDRIQKPTAN